jgi:hypothetical protein
MAEIGDLALVLVRQYPGPLVLTFATGAFLWALVNLFLIGWIPWQESAYGINDEEATGEIMRYLAWMALLVILQTPAAGVMTTIFLGQAVFEQRPTWSSTWREAMRQFKRWFWKLGVVRFAIVPWVVLAIRWGQPANVFWDVMVPLVVLIWVSIVRASSPFMPEILLLEQCELRSKSPNAITARRRSKSLHGPMSGELSGRFLFVSGVLFLLAVSVGYSLIWLRGIAIGRWDIMNLLILLVVYPFALWTAAGISVIIRMLNYLDCRIRLEGWEVELAVRAEAIRQFGDPVPIDSVAVKEAAPSEVAPSEAPGVLS